MNEAEAYVYVDLIRHGQKNLFTGRAYTLIDVPENIRASVEEKLKEMNVQWQKD